MKFQVVLLKKLESKDAEKLDFLLVQCKGKKMKSRFVAQVISTSTKHYEVKYLKKITKSNNFVLDENDELYLLPAQDIVCKLPPPVWKI
jgi:hypothetical protein